MSKQPDYASCHSGSDFIRELHDHPAIIKAHWAGDHLTVWGPGGRYTLVNSRWEYPRYLRCKIVKTLLALGLALFVASLIIH